MNDEFKPYPPLDFIEDRLFAGLPRDGRETMAEAARDDVIPEIRLSAWLRDSIELVARAMSTPKPSINQAGQIWSVTYRGTRNGQEVRGRIPMLFDRPCEGEGWQGWLVSCDPDYASRADVIIDTRELGIAPAACMVQTWNRVEALRDGDAPFLGQVDPVTLAAIRAVAAERPAARPGDGFPGVLGQREIGEGVFVLTGQDLGPAHDPRWGYRRLYYELSTMLPEVAPGHDYDD